MLTLMLAVPWVLVWLPPHDDEQKFENFVVRFTQQRQWLLDTVGRGCRNVGSNNEEGTSPKTWHVDGLLWNIKYLGCPLGPLRSRMSRAALAVPHPFTLCRVLASRLRSFKSTRTKGSGAGVATGGILGARAATLPVFLLPCLFLRISVRMVLS